MSPTAVTAWATVETAEIIRQNRELIQGTLREAEAVEAQVSALALIDETRQDRERPAEA